MGRKRKDRDGESEHAAGNGILSRRALLEGALIAGAAGAGMVEAAAEPLAVPRWSTEPGAAFVPYGQPSHFESKVVRDRSRRRPIRRPGIGVVRTPHQLLDGMMTPSGLHFERSHSGAPDIDPDQHRLVIHGLVKRPLVFTMEALSRYPRGVAHRLPRMRRQQRRAQCAAAAAAQRPGHSRPAVVLGLDRRAAVDAARRGRRRSRGEMGAGRRRRLLRHEPFRSARQGDG